MSKTRILIAGVAALVALTAAFPLVAAPGILGGVAMPSGAENTVINVQNVGTANALIAVEYYNPDGSLVCSKTVTDVPPGSIRSFYQATEACLAPGFRGVGVVSSDQPIVALEERDILNSADDKSYSIANAAATGGYKLAVPIALNELVTHDWNSRIAIVNAGTVMACVRATHYLQPDVGGTQVGTVGTVVDSPAGLPGCPGGGHPIPAGGQLTYGRVGSGVTQFPAATNNNEMAILLEVLNPGDNRIAANVDIYRSDGNRLLASYTASVINDAAPATDDVGTDIIVPFALKSVSGHYTEIGAMVVAGGPADVNIQYIGVVEGSGVPVNHTVTLPGVASVGIHSIYAANESQIPVGFIGYARITSAATVASLVIRGKQTSFRSGIDEATYAAASGVPADQAGTKWSVPAVFRRFAGGGVYVGYNSEIQVQVADGSTASVTITMLGDPANGCFPIGPFTTTYTVVGSQNFYTNLESAAGPNGFGNSAPDCFFGGASITANKPVIVISNMTSDKFPTGDTDAMFNGFKTQ
ncbi:MAG: hypothetical protein ACR2HN_12095 [Tepidiformaceae bacterium]